MRATCLGREQLARVEDVLGSRAAFTARRVDLRPSVRAQLADAADAALQRWGVVTARVQG